jgi:hypothetical protein
MGHPSRQFDKLTITANGTTLATFHAWTQRPTAFGFRGGEMTLGFRRQIAGPEAVTFNDH